MAHGPIPGRAGSFPPCSCLSVFGVVLAGPAIRDNGLRAVWMVGGLALVLVPSIAIAYAKTEGGWRWRNGDER